MKISSFVRAAGERLRETVTALLPTFYTPNPSFINKCKTSFWNDFLSEFEKNKRIQTQVWVVLRMCLAFCMRQSAERYAGIILYTFLTAQLLCSQSSTTVVLYVCFGLYLECYHVTILLWTLLLQSKEVLLLCCCMTAGSFSVSALMVLCFQSISII